MSGPSVSPWPRRAAWIACLVTLPIFLIGGTVTTLRVGMAVPDWPTTFGQNMFAYPLSEMLGNTGVFWEHSHRLWGALVGACVVLLAAVIWFREPRRSVRWLGLGALLGVGAQGILGGVRVTENSPQLAFLHGAFAQALFALLAAILFLESSAWRSAESAPSADGRRLRTLSSVAVALVYAQTVLGAWLRHSGSEVAQALHVAGAVFATLRVIQLRGALVRAGIPVFRRIASWLFALLLTQLALGVLAWVAVFLVTGPDAPVSVTEAVFATAHVLCGAMLLATCTAAFVFVRRCTTDAPEAAGARLEAAR